jgi:hypothetical protein
MGIQATTQRGRSVKKIKSHVFVKFATANEFLQAIGIPLVAKFMSHQRPLSIWFLLVSEGREILTQLHEQGICREAECRILEKKLKEANMPVSWKEVRDRCGEIQPTEEIDLVEIGFNPCKCGKPLLHGNLTVNGIKVFPVARSFQESLWLLGKKYSEKKRPLRDLVNFARGLAKVKDLCLSKKEADEKETKCKTSLITPETSEDLTCKN